MRSTTVVQLLLGLCVLATNLSTENGSFVAAASKRRRAGYVDLDDDDDDDRDLERARRRRNRVRGTSGVIIGGGDNDDDDDYAYRLHGKQSSEPGAPMKAVQVVEFGEPETALKFTEVKIPEVGPTQVLVQIFAAGVNPVETYIRSGKYHKHPSLPYIPGNDGAGVIRRVGSDVTQWEAGMRVWINTAVTGTYAQFAVAEQDQVAILPHFLSYQQGAAVSVAYRTAYKALVTRGNLQAGQSVLVHGGTGGVGIAAIHLAKLYGASPVYATAGTEDGRKLLLRNGADWVFNHRNANYLDEIANEHPAGIDLIVEMLANVNLGEDLKLLGKNGIVTVVGSRGEVTINPRDLMVQSSQIRGVLGGTPLEEQQVFQGVKSAIASRAFEPVVGVGLMLDKAAEAHREVLDHKHTGGGAMGKVVLLPF